MVGAVNGAFSSVLVAALLGAVAGLGVLIGVAGLIGRAVVGAQGAASPRRWMLAVLAVDRLVLRVTFGLFAATITFLVTGWAVAAVFAAAAAAWAPSAARTAGRTQREVAKVEAIASWTEQLRDTIAAANGLESAIAATAAIAPAPISGAVERLGARLAYERLGDALRRFASDVDHPTADFVVAALLIAAEREARDLSGLLGQLAITARDEARMRTRVWVGRARLRTSVRVIGAVVPAMVLAVMAVDPHYFDAYDSIAGQAMLLAIGGVFGLALWLMERMGRLEMPDRFVGLRAASPVPASAVGRTE
jgi:Flp pilus assembly protein TadB